MATDYAINGSAASLAPFSQRWVPLQVGIDHNGEPIYSLNHNIVLEFDTASVTYAQQWLNAASVSGSKTFDVLDRWGLNFVTLSPVYVEMTNLPEIKLANAGPFTLTIIGAQPSVL